MTVHLETARGVRIASCLGAIGDFEFLSTHSAETVCIRFVDPFGHTVFNRSQCRVLFKEWEELGRHCPSELAPWWDCVAQLIVRCRDEVHLYVRFTGM